MATVAEYFSLARPEKEDYAFHYLIFSFMQYVPRCLNIALDFDICSRDLQFSEDPIMILK